MSDKRDDILQATLTLIADRGFHGTPMSVIAEQAGVGAGTIYRYFEGKEDLINKLFLELKAGFSQAMLAGFSDELTFEEKFKTAWLNTLSYCLEHPREMIFIEQYHNSPYLTPETEAETMRYLQPVLLSMQEAVTAGVIKDMPMQVTQAFVYDIVVALVKRHLAGTITLDDDTIRLAMDACWDAVHRA